jgi:hypothetical protein
VRVDPHDGEVLAVAAGEFGEGRDTDRALAAQGDDPGRIVLADDLQGLDELGEDSLLGLDPIGQLQARVVHGDRRGRGRVVVGRQDGGQHGRADGIAPAGHREGELGGERLDAGGAGALPLRPQQPQGHTRIAGIAPR